MVVTKRNRQVAGLRAKRMGELFESLFHSSCVRQRIAVTRVPDGCRVIGAGKIIRVRSPFDWILTQASTTALVDTKTCDWTAFRNSAIDPHQLRELLKHAVQGSPAGYVVWLRPEDQIIFIPAQVLARASLIKGSISPGAPGVTLLGSTKALDCSRIFWKTAPFSTLKSEPTDGPHLNLAQTPRAPEKTEP